MATYVILSRISPEAFRVPGEFKELATTVSAKIKEECPNVTWRESYATMGRFDVVDIVESDDPDAVERAAMIIRAYGHSTTETMPATPWKSFLSKL
ncbi:MAG: GYD domain-containing protein [Chloroflexota bacterium]